jgi:transcription-repair coupling factor (superfamily II helicase)
MALTGIRDMSTVDTPPEDRQPVLTYVGQYEEGLALGAVRRELLREGQVFWVHNRVATIDRQVAWLQEQFPEARIVVAHGQMDEEQLERQMVRFWDRDADILVSTVIIESGLDVPNANTLIVDTAHLLGLSQMYQLRGRVGRSSERAFAYFFFPPQRELTEEAHERLATISKHQSLGSGFQIALRDLEIRGAGNLLGAEQHGHIAAVGFDTYCRLLQESVAEMQGRMCRRRRISEWTCRCARSSRRGGWPKRRCGWICTGGSRSRRTIRRWSASARRRSTATVSCRPRSRRCSPWPRSA